MDFERIDISELLPQQPPFVMIDKLLNYGEVTETALTVKDDNLFCDNGLLSEAGIVENIAQTCAARTGYFNKYINKSAVQLGFIGAIRNMEIFRFPKTGEVLHTQIRILEEIFRMTLIRAVVNIGNETIAGCEMKISL
ncbi:MAG: pseudouridylate synthase [Dysgonamonadaceae bacterium]|nr:pseudouridylate synthase [Dysgonamonadaceae bacterium]